MQTILVPVDFSPASRNAVQYAGELAKKLQAGVFLFHVYVLPAPVSEVPYIMVSAEEIQRDNETMIKKEAQYLNDQFGIAVEWLVRIGIPSDEVKQLLTERDFQLIIMGMKGAGGLDKMIGSTTITVIRKVATPVLIVPHDARYQPLQHITYASDFSYSITAALFRPLQTLAKTYHATIHILHVHRSEADAGKNEMVSRKMDELIFDGYAHAYTSVVNTSVTAGINDYLKRQNSQLLVMVAHKHSFFERIFAKNDTTTMAYETHIPLLVLQDRQ